MRKWIPLVLTALTFVTLSRISDVAPVLIGGL